MSRIEVTTRSGRRHVEEASHPKGHARNPMSDADVEAKFAGLAHGLMSKDAAGGLVQALWAIDQAQDVSTVLSQIRV
jgi:2-methylcitrate dehydratase